MLSDTRSEIISEILGWSYFILWSLSFYPQVLNNHRRRSTDGLSVDFAALNLLGLTAYTIFNACLLFSPLVRAEYAQRHPRSPEPTVQWNDFVYALHGALVCCWIGSHFLCAKFWNFQSKTQRPQYINSRDHRGLRSGGGPGNSLRLDVSIVGMD